MVWYRLNTFPLKSLLFGTFTFILYMSWHNVQMCAYLHMQNTLKEIKSVMHYTDVKM